MGVLFPKHTRRTAIWSQYSDGYLKAVAPYKSGGRRRLKASLQAKDQREHAHQPKATSAAVLTIKLGCPAVDIDNKGGRCGGDGKRSTTVDRAVCAIRPGPTR